MSQPTALGAALKGFVASHFADAAEVAYQQVCAELNAIVGANPERKPELDIIHANAVQMRDLLIHQGELIEKVYALADANRQVADKATMAYAILEEAVIEQDDNNPLVGRLIEDIQDACYSEYGTDAEFTDQVNERLAQRMSDAIPGISPHMAAKFIDIVGSSDKHLPEFVEELLTDAMQGWEMEGDGE